MWDLTFAFQVASFLTQFEVCMLRNWVASGKMKGSMELIMYWYFALLYSD